MGSAVVRYLTEGLVPSALGISFLRSASSSDARGSSCQKKKSTVKALSVTRKNIKFVASLKVL